MIIYIKHQGAWVGRQGQTLVVKKEDFKQTIYTHRLKQLVIMGNVTLSNPALSLLCKEQIDTIFLTKNGRYKGRLESDENKNVFLTKRQFDSLNNPEFGLTLAQSIVGGKISNMATLLGRLKRRNKHLDGRLFENRIKGIRQLLKQSQHARTVNILRGYEGQSTKLFFEGFRYGFREEWHFRKRVRRPPTDPVNAVLSLLYTLLLNRIYAAVRVAGLNPMVGYLHALEYGRHSLTLDLIEEFRSIIAETCTLSLFNLKILQQDDFYYEEPLVPEVEAQTRAHVTDDTIGYIYENPDDGMFDLPAQRVGQEEELEHEPSAKRPCRLNQAAFKRVLEAFEEKINTEFTHPLTGVRITYAEALVVQARHFRSIIEGEQKTYQPLQMK
ncbi:MAG: CRISPR-associated endonuclease Cas1 [Deltaproteobacteria bacterium]|jgi:CRISPR-associated protein Cas1|nr:CRISPR-associated endonuclease Cas1 [Deltaproteobacteria bacterium]